MCPLCRVAHKADREYMWQFSEEGFGNEAAMDVLACAHGFCTEHADMLRRIDVEMKSMLGISTIYVELFADLASELAALEALPCEAGACPACANRDVALRKNARYLLALTAAAGATAEKFSGSAGLCFPHFELVWASGGTSQARRLILDVQRRAVADILDDLREFIRKEGVESKHEPKSTEQDAWRRAIQLTAGWPAPQESAGVPEAHPLQAG